LLLRDITTLELTAWELRIQKLAALIKTCSMRLSSLLPLAVWLACSPVVISAGSGKKLADDDDVKKACPDYKQWATFKQYVLRSRIGTPSLLFF
jgi:hypothetical protein